MSCDFLATCIRPYAKINYILAYLEVHNFTSKFMCIAVVKSVEALEK